MIPGPLALTFTLVFLALASVVCASGAHLFWTSGYYGRGGWDPLLLLPIGYFAASVTTIFVLFFSRHSKATWRREGGVLLGVLLTVLLPLLFFFFAVAGSS